VAELEAAVAVASDETVLFEAHGDPVRGRAGKVGRPLELREG